MTPDAHLSMVHASTWGQVLCHCLDLHRHFEQYFFCVVSKGLVKRF